MLKLQLTGRKWFVLANSRWNCLVWNEIPRKPTTIAEKQNIKNINLTYRNLFLCFSYSILIIYLTSIYKMDKKWCITYYILFLCIIYTGFFILPPPCIAFFIPLLQGKTNSIIKFHGRNIDYRMFVVGKNKFDR